MPLLVEANRVWTFADLDAWLPEFDSAGNQVDWRRFEILDGALVMSPSASSRHEVAVMAIRDEIRDNLPRDCMAVGSLGIDLGRSYLVPDLVVARREVLLAGVPKLAPPNVLLVVEVVSPSSRTMDRVTKPAQYAAAGIGAYWRIETDPAVSLTAYTLPEGSDRYREVGAWGTGQVAEVDQPFRARIEIDALVPSQ